jgi:hypothetical protein
MYKRCFISEAKVVGGLTLSCFFFSFCVLQALTLSPNNSMIFQNLGGAFASQGKDQHTP